MKPNLLQNVTDFEETDSSTNSDILVSIQIEAKL